MWFAIKADAGERFDEIVQCPVSTHFLFFYFRIVQFTLECVMCTIVHCTCRSDCATACWFAVSTCIQMLKIGLAALSSFQCIHLSWGIYTLCVLRWYRVSTHFHKICWGIDHRFIQLVVSLSSLTSPMLVGKNSTISIPKGTSSQTNKVQRIYFVRYFYLSPLSLDCKQFARKLNTFLANSFNDSICFICVVAPCACATKNNSLFVGRPVNWCDWRLR